MNKIKYRILALLLCFTMVLSSFSGIPANAAMDSEATTENEVAAAKAAEAVSDTTPAVTDAETSGAEATEVETESEAAATEVIDTAVLPESKTEEVQDSSAAVAVKTAADTTDTALSTDAGIETTTGSDTTKQANTEEQVPTNSGETKSEVTNKDTATKSATADTPKALTLTQTVEGYEVVLTADAGVLPTDAVLSASLVKNSAATEKIETAIEKEMDAGKKLAETIAFDITIYDKDGNEIQPDTKKGNVTVTFQNIETNQTVATEAEVFHVQDDYSSADAVSTQTQGDEVAFQAEHFSTYVITFSYYNEPNDEYYDYNLATNASLKVSDLLTKLGVAFSNVTSATSDTPTVLTVTGSGNDTCIEGAGAGTAALTVTYDGSSTTTIDVTVATAAGTCGDNLTWALSGSAGNYTLTISGSGAMYDYESSFEDGTWNSNSPWSTIPVTIKALVIVEDVTSIGNGAFCGLQLTGELTIPDKVTSIGANAFGGCSGLTGNLTIPPGVTSIGANAFNGCSGLTGNLTIPSGVTSISANAFGSCSGLTGNLTIPSGVTSIGQNAFFGCSKLTGNLTIPSGVSSIGNYAFYNCYGFDGALTIPSGVIIGESAFYGCSGLTGNLTIPSGATSISNYAFGGCSGLTGNLTIPFGVTSIGQSAFDGCSGLTGNLTIPSGVTDIGNYAFSSCSGLNKAIIPKNVQTIGSSAFSSWKAGSYIYNLSSVDMTNGNHYSGATLGAVYTVTTHVDGVATATKVPGDNEPTTEIADPTKDGYEFLGWYTDAAFITKWDSTKAITGNMDLYAKFETTVASGNCGAMGDGSNLTYKITTADNTNYTLTISGSGTMKDYAYGATPWYSYRDNLTTLVMEPGMTKIGAYAFCDLMKVSGSLSIPDSVTSIGNYAFYFCCKLTGDLTIPSGVTSIGNGTFGECYGFNGNLTIPSGVINLGEYVFYDCKKLTGALTIPSGVTSVGKYAFSLCSGLTGALTIPSGVISIGDYAFQNCSGFSGSLIIPIGATSIGKYAFYNCSGLTGAITISNSVTSVGDNAFYIMNSTTKIYNLSEVTLTAGNHYYSAANLGNVYTITTHVDGVAAAIKVPGNGESTATIADPTKENGEFLAWYTDEAFTTKWDSTQAITGNMDLYAQFLTTIVGGNCGAVGNESNLTYKVTTTDNTNYTLTISGSGAMKDYSYYDSVPWYSYRDKLTKLVLNGEITKVGDYAFYGCSGLKGNLTIPSGVTSIGISAFNGCSGFTGNLTIPTGVTSIGKKAFYGCSGFTGNLTIPSEVTDIGQGIFAYCSGLDGVLTIPTGVTSIGISAFVGCSGLKGNLTIPSGVTNIGQSAFAGCSGLTGNLTIPSGVTSIGACAFQDCSKLTGNLTIPTGVTSIGQYTFAGCSGLTGNLTIPSEVISIGHGAFDGCTGLNKAVIPNSVQSVDDFAFNNWRTGSIIYNLSSVTMIADMHYSGATLGNVYTVTTHVDGTTSAIKVPGDGETTVTIPNAVKVGYVFTDWYTDSAFSTDKLWNGNNQTVSQSLDLYAKLQKVLTVSDISGISNTDAFAYNGSKEIPVTLTLSGYDPSGEGTPVTETATATATVSSANAGTYTGYTLSDIVLTNGNSSNYTLTGVTNGSIVINSGDSVNFGITITKKLLEVKAADVTLSVGDSMPELTDNNLTFSGFITGEDKAVLSGTLDFTISQNHTNSEVSNGTVTPEGYTSTNYDLTYIPGKLVVTAKTFGSTPYTASGSNNGKTGAYLWYTGYITITPDSAVCGNFKYISISTDGGNSYSDWSTSALIPAKTGETAMDTDSGSVMIKLSTAEEGTPGTDCAVVTLNEAFTYQLDTTAPTGTITIETNSFKNFLHTITFGLLFNKDITVSIAADSSPVDLSGTTTYLYKDTTTSTTAKTYEELDALSEAPDVTTGWKQTGSFSVTADEQFAVYGKIVDGAGHVTYLNTEGVIVDKTAPVITNLPMPAETRTDVSAGVELTADEAGTYYYVVLGSSDTAPASGEEIAQTTASVRGSGAVVKDIKSVISISGLTANTGYVFYATVKDAAGNYADIIQGYFITEKTMVTIGTAPTIIGTYGQQVSDMTLTDGIAKVGETTIPGSWSIVSAYTDIPSVGTQTSYSVLFTPADTENYKKAAVDVIPTVTARSLTAAGVTAAVTGTYTYTGTAIIPDVSVTDTGATITADDYDITYSNNSGAGENTASVTVTGKGNYTGTVTKTFSIAKADTAITVAAGSESYTKTFGDAAFSLSGITKTGDGTLTYASSEPSAATVSAEGTVTIKGAGTATITVSLPATNNYNAATDKTITVTVGKASVPSITDITKSYLYTTGMDSESIDLSALLPKDRGETTYQKSVTDTANILSNTSAVSADGTLTYSVNPGTIGDTAVINVTASMANYGDTTLKVVIDLTDKTVVDITGITIADKTYDGKAATVTGTASVKKIGTTESVTIDGLTYAYTSTDGKGYDSSTAPTAAGSYQLVISVPDSNTAYKGSTAPISFTIAKKPVFIVTEPAITGIYGQKVCDMTLTDGVVKAGDAQIPGSWSFASSYTDVPSVDSQTAYSVLFTPDDNYMSVTAEVIPTIAARSIKADGITVSEISETYTYTGEAFTPGITVTDSQAAITATDYDITYSNNSGAGVNTASVTVTGKGNYTGTVTKTFSIAKADTAITVASGSESYAKTFGDAAFSLTGITKTGDGTLTYTSSSASVATVSAEGTVTIKGAGTTSITVSLPATDNCNAAADKTITVSVGKAAALTIADITKSYVYTAGIDSQSIDLSAIMPKDKGQTTYQLGTITDTDAILNEAPTVSADGTLTYNVKPGTTGDTATINVTASMANYNDTTLKVVVNLTDKTVVDITGITIADKTYDGKAATVTGTASVKKTVTTEIVDINGLTYSYTSTDGKEYDSTTAPTDAGSYQLVISVPDSNKTYKGSTEPLTFTIAKKMVTVKALDKEIQTGAAIPDLSKPVKDTDYTVTGLVESDKLSGTVTLQYAVAHDNTKAGSTAIVIAGVTAGDNYSLSLINGTLTIKQAESSSTGSQTTTTTESSSTGGTTTTPMDSGSTASGTPTVSTESTGETTETATSSATTSAGSTAAQTTSSAAGTNAGNTQAETTGAGVGSNAANNGTEASMQTADGKTVTGWEAIATAIQSLIEEATNSATNAGEAGNAGNMGNPATVMIELHDATTVPKEILEEIKGKNIDLVLSLGNGITWTINGMSITGDTLTDIDLNVTKGTDRIPADTVAKLTGDKSALQLELAHSGQFGFEATLTINLESENAGLYANLFYYNEETGEFELLGNSEIDENGNANLTFKHASSYVIVLDTAPMKDTNDNKADTAKSDTGSSAKVANTVAAEAKDNSLILFLILGIVVAAAVAGSVIYVFYRNKKEHESNIDDFEK